METSEFLQKVYGGLSDGYLSITTFSKDGEARTKWFDNAALQFQIDFSSSENEKDYVELQKATPKLLDAPNSEMHQSSLQCTKKFEMHQRKILGALYQYYQPLP